MKSTCNNTTTITTNSAADKTAADDILNRRGIAATAAAAGWKLVNWAGQPGWTYPVIDVTTGQTIARRFKAASSDSRMKYSWMPRKPDTPAADWYISQDAQQAIAAADGVAYLANGEPARLAYQAAGIQNVIATTLSEVSVPSTTVQLLNWLGITTLLHPIDKDEAGHRSAIAWRDALLDAGTTYRPLDWPDWMPDKADANDAWLAVSQDASAFSELLDGLAAHLLPAPVQATYNPPSDTIETPDELVSVVMNRLGIDASYNANGFSRRAIACPVVNHQHDSQRPAAHWHQDGFLHCQKCGQPYSITQLADALNIDWRQYYRTARKAANRPVAPFNGNSSINTPDELYKPLYRPVELTAPHQVNVDVAYISQASKAIPSRGLVVLSSDKGTGKTSYAVDVARTYQQRGKGILAVTPFISLTSAAAERYGLEFYQDVPAASRGAVNRLAITFKSVAKFDKLDTPPAPALLVLDELTKMLEQLDSNLFKGGQAARAWAQLQRLVSQAELVLVMDADIQQHHIDLLTSWRPDVHLVLNKHNRKAGQLVNHSSAASLESAFINGLADDERAGRPVLLAANTRGAVERLGTYVHRLGYNVLTVHSGNSQNIKQQAFLKNPDAGISQYDAVLLSPSAMTGIDIQTPVYRKFGLFTYTRQGQPSAAPGVSGCGQLFERARNADESHIYAKDVDASELADADELYQNDVDAALNSAAICGLTLAADGRYKFDGTTDAIARLICADKAADRTSRNRFAKALLDMLARNYSISWADTVGQHQDALKAVQDELKDTWRQWMLTLPAMTQADYDELASRGQLKPEHEAQLERGAVESFYGQAVDDELLDYDKSGAGRAVTRLAADVALRPDDELAISDLDEFLDSELLSRRRHRLHKARLLRDLVSRLGITSGEAVSKPELIAAADAWLDDHQDDVRRLFSHRHQHRQDTWPLVRRLLRSLGIYLKAVNNRNPDTPPAYKLDTARWQVTLRYAQQHVDASRQDVDTASSEAVSQAVSQLAMT